MTAHLEAILFDMGGTLRRTINRDDEHKSKMVRQILVLLGSDAPPMEFTQLLTQRAAAYKRWAEKSLIELNEINLWMQWMLPDWPAEQVSKCALQLNQIWREATGARVIYPEMKAVVSELFRRGYHLGLVSNTVSSTEVPRALQELKISGCFDTIVLSCVFGGRKPDPAILLDAAKRIGVDPARCAYVGDRPDRDVAACRAAGFSKAIIVRDPQNPLAPTDDPSRTPDHIIDDLMELLELFPSCSNEKTKKSRIARGSFSQAGGSRVYDASLSTMWGIDKFPTLHDFSIAAQRIGFGEIELNHQVNSAMLAETDLKKYRFSSVHEPCPADISIETLKNRDWLISSTDEECRKQGMAAIKKSIDLAAKIDANVVVVHAGRTAVDRSIEIKLRDLFGKGQAQTTEYLETKKNLVEIRAKSSDAQLEAVIKSLTELLEYAARYGIRLGLENRYNYLDIPSQDEMALLLDLAGPDQLGFIYDVGHAQAMDRLGFYPHETWLKRYAGRIFGVHLHDAIGIDDHYAPGLGDVDFHAVTAYLPRGAFRTCEFQSFNTIEQIKNALRLMVDIGCINLI